MDTKSDAFKVMETSDLIAYADGEGKAEKRKPREMQNWGRICLLWKEAAGRKELNSEIYVC